MDKIVNKVTGYYIQKKYIPKDKEEVYKYGFKLILSDIINFLLIAILGLICEKFIESIAFLITLCVIRQFSGGYHAKTFWLCRVSMIVTFLFVVGLSELMLLFKTKCLYIIIVNLISVLIIGILAPVKHPNKKLNDKQKRQNKIKAILTSLIMSVISVWLTSADIYIGVIISMTLSAVMVLMIVGLIIGKGGKNNV